MLPIDPKPTRPAANLAGYRAWVIRWRAETFFAKNPDKYPCLYCWGRGWVDDDRYSPGPYDRPDSLTCPTCQGTRCCEKKVFQAAYKKAIEEWQKDLQAWRQRETARKSGLKKLTAAERKALGL